MSTNSFKVKKSLVLNPTTQPSVPQNGEMYYDSGANSFKVRQNGSWVDIGSGAGATIPPTQQLFTSSGAATYTPSSADIAYILVRMVGGGAGGGGGGAGSGGAAGSDSTFEDTGNFTVTAAGGSAGGSGGAAGGLGGGYNLDGQQGYGLTGGSGGGFSQNSASANALAGPVGGDAPIFGGGGRFGTGGAGTAESGLVNTGGGGQAGSTLGASLTTGSGGGSGGYVEFVIPGPLAASYSLNVGAGGSGGGAGASSGAAGSGGVGIIVVEEYYAASGTSAAPIKYGNTAGTFILTPFILEFTNQDYDPQSLYNSGLFVAPVAGYYHVSVCLTSVSTLPTSAAWTVEIKKNTGAPVTQYLNSKAGTGAGNTTNSVAVSGDVHLDAGEEAFIVTYSDSAISLVTTAGSNTLSIHKI